MTARDRLRAQVDAYLNVEGDHDAYRALRAEAERLGIMLAPARSNSGIDYVVRLSDALRG